MCVAGRARSMRRTTSAAVTSALSPATRRRAVRGRPWTMMRIGTIPFSAVVAPITGPDGVAVTVPPASVRATSAASSSGRRARMSTTPWSPPVSSSATAANTSVPRSRRRRGGDAGEGQGHRRGLVEHVDRAAAPHLAVDDLAAERVAGPLVGVDRDDVGVARAAAASARSGRCPSDAAIERGALGQADRMAPLDERRRQHAGQHVGVAPFAAAVRAGRSLTQPLWRRPRGRRRIEAIQPARRSAVTSGVGRGAGRGARAAWCRCTRCGTRRAPAARGRAARRCRRGRGGRCTARR